MKGLDLSVMGKFLHFHCVTCRIYTVDPGSAEHNWQILIFTSAYTSNFINRCLGSLFWLLSISSKFGPLFLCWQVLITFAHSANHIYM